MQRAGGGWVGDNLVTMLLALASLCWRFEFEKEVNIQEANKRESLVIILLTAYAYTYLLWKS